MRLLSLDLATRLGFAYGDLLVGDPVSGWHQLPSGTRENPNVGGFASAYNRFLRDMIEEARPDKIVMEEPMLAQADRGSPVTGLKLTGLCYHTEFVCDELGIDCRQVHTSTWKAAFVGGKVSKKMKPYPVTRKCHERGFNLVKDNNEADAIGIWVYAAGKLAPKAALRFDPLGRAGLLIA